MTDKQQKGSLLTERTLKTLLLFEENQNLSLTEISNHLGISQSAVFRIVSTLSEYGFLSRDINKRYNLGPKFIKLAQNVNINIRDVALPYLEEVSIETGESVYLSLSVDQYFYYFIEGIESPHPVKWTVDLGNPIPSFAGSAGKAHLAFNYHGEELLDIINKTRFEAYTKNTITNQKSFIDEIAKIKEQGYAISYGERYEDIVGISVPIFNESKLRKKTNLYAVLSLFFPAYRYNEEKKSKYIKSLQNASKNISNVLN